DEGGARSAAPRTGRPPCRRPRALRRPARASRAEAARPSVREGAAGRGVGTGLAAGTGLTRSSAGPQQSTASLVASVDNIPHGAGGLAPALAAARARLGLI